MKKVAILQSNYIPWKGYFDLIAAVDEFIIYDDVQFTKNDWRNRNQIKTSHGVQWLTVPVGQGIKRRVLDVTINNQWQAKHWKSLFINYRRAPFFDEIAEWLEPLYLDRNYDTLSNMNRVFIDRISDYLGITTRITNSIDYTFSPWRPNQEEKTTRLVDICCQSGGTEYVSGPAARDYIVEKEFSDRGIKLTWFNYEGYPEHPQLWGEFVHRVTILDLLFNCGQQAPRYMKNVLA